LLGTESKPRGAKQDGSEQVVAHNQK
jgi:hypothetical protein